MVTAWEKMINAGDIEGVEAFYEPEAVASGAAKRRRRPRFDNKLRQTAGGGSAQAG